MTPEGCRGDGGAQEQSLTSLICTDMTSQLYFAVRGGRLYDIHMTTSL